MSVGNGNYVNELLLAHERAQALGTQNSDMFLILPAAWQTHRCSW
jgi:hypothetical protein